MASDIAPAPRGQAPPAHPASPVPRTLAVPLIETAIPRRLHPYWRQLRKDSRRWVLKQGLNSPSLNRRYSDDLRYTDLVAGYYLGAPEQVLGAIADFSIWFFAWDDRHDSDVKEGRSAEWSRLCADLHRALDAPQPELRHPDPLVAAFADCVDRLYSRLGNRWNRRFAQHFHPVVDAYDLEFRNRLTETVPTVEDYLDLRRLTFGMAVWVDCLELAAEYELPDEVYNWPAYQRAGLATQEFSAWYNDLCSLPKELAEGEIHNLGISIAHHRGLPVEAAAAEVHRRVSRRVIDFLRDEQEVYRQLDVTGVDAELRTAVERCLANMRNWFSSVYWFHHESGRYQLRPEQLTAQQLQQEQQHAPAQLIEPHQLPTPHHNRNPRTDWERTRRNT